jgi:hypothetical protein
MEEKAIDFGNRFHSLFFYAAAQGLSRLLASTNGFDDVSAKSPFFAAVRISSKMEFKAERAAGVLWHSAGL